MTAENKNIVIAYQMAVGEVLKNGSGNGHEQYLAENAKWHLPKSMAQHGGAIFEGVSGITQMLTENIRLFYQPDTIDVDFRSMISEGDFVHMHFGMSAKTANGKDYNNDYQLLCQLQDGKIANVWEYFDAHHLIELLA